MNLLNVAQDEKIYQHRCYFLTTHLVFSCVLQTRYFYSIKLFYFCHSQLKRETSLFAEFFCRNKVLVSVCHYKFKIILISRSMVTGCPIILDAKSNFYALVNNCLTLPTFIWDNKEGEGRLPD